MCIRASKRLDEGTLSSASGSYHDNDRVVYAGRRYWQECVCIPQGNGGDCESPCKDKDSPLQRAADIRRNKHDV